MTDLESQVNEKDIPARLEADIQREYLVTTEVFFVSISDFLHAAVLDTRPLSPEESFLSRWQSDRMQEFAGPYFIDELSPAAHAAARQLSGWYWAVRFKGPVPKSYATTPMRDLLLSSRALDDPSGPFKTSDLAQADMEAKI